jgi:hypothetical protein
MLDCRDSGGLLEGFLAVMDSPFFCNLSLNPATP